MLRRLLGSLALLTAFLACALGLALLGYYELQEPIELQQGQAALVWQVDKGSSLTQVNRQLHKREILSHPKLLSLYARVSGRAAIQAGHYQIESGETALQLLEKFNRGAVISYQITFPEGWNFQQWITQLATVEQFADIRGLSQGQIMTAANIDKAHPEGWLFPDTYSYTHEDSALDIVARAHRKMLQVLDQAWQGREQGLPYASAYDALIMASIVEKETGQVAERAAIAGVFVRRLDKGMRLQTDPTVIYGLGNAYKGNITRQHLKMLTPHNTYRINGLPPTPIAMPSAAAIEAALHPEAGTSLYFVARGDGGHHFSDSLEEHQKAVRQYQINQRAVDYQSAPKAKN
ncbi:endolytic transglycosylase MltG [SAR92 clade bacterium H455]|uniref:Endolytic murein transglycosylase n=1 Tax=SAR92 clade bacterium H455 TaxID=2974818 RepID=A0ABY5TJG5_9GAMM|nr:endolytic transglycosylase MltG [SAR92 clade bacterium H455]